MKALLNKHVSRVGGDLLHKIKHSVRCYYAIITVDDYSVSIIAMKNSRTV